MTRITNCCYTNLNYNSLNTIKESIGEDYISEITVGTEFIVLGYDDPDRRIIKIYTQEYSNQSASLLLSHTSYVAPTYFAFALPEKYLYENTLQASQPLSVVCTEGTALIKFTVANKL